MRRKNERALTRQKICCFLLELLLKLVTSKGGRVIHKEIFGRPRLPGRAERPVR